MFILQNLKDFMDNPMGKGSMAIPNRKLIKEDLNNRYDKLVKNKKISVQVYKNGDEYVMHFLIPSESERDNTYDVVLYFTMDEEDFKYDNFLNRYYVKFFSNCPSFVYTYAFAFNEYGLFIADFANKYDDKVLEEDPITRNPGEVISYEKSIYFACRFLELNRKYMNKALINVHAKPLDIDLLKKTIRTEARIQLEIESERKRLKREKEKEEERKKKDAKKVDTPAKAVRGVTDKDKVTGRKNSHKNTIGYVKPLPKIQARKSTINKNK